MAIIHANTIILYARAGQPNIFLPLHALDTVCITATMMYETACDWTYLGRSRTTGRIFVPFWQHTRFFNFI